MARRTLPHLAAPALLALLAACAHGRPTPAAAPGAPPESTSRAFDIRGHGRLLVRLPPGWSAVEVEEDAAVPSIRLAKEGARLVALLTPLWNPGEPESPDARADTAQLLAELGRRKALAGSLEREIPLAELSGPGVRGAWFEATDRELAGRDAGPDEFRHVLQGAAAVGPVILGFTLLDDGPGPWRAEVLDVVRTARHLPDGAAAAEEDALEPLPGVATVPLRVALPGRSWAVLVDLPGFAVARVAGGKVAPGALHVLGRSAETDLVASVLLSPAGAARDAAGCRDEALQRLRASVAGLDDVQGGGGAGAAARLSYRVRAGPGGAPERHAHAFLWRDGVCASVHVSKAAPAPEDEGRVEAVLSSLRLGEDL